MKQFDITVTIPSIYKLKIDAETFEEAKKWVKDRYDLGVNIHALAKYQSTYGDISITQNGEATLIPKAHKVKITRKLVKYIIVEGRSKAKALDAAEDMLVEMQDKDFTYAGDSVEIAEVIYEEAKDAISGKETDKD